MSEETKTVKAVGLQTTTAVGSKVFVGLGETKEEGLGIFFEFTANDGTITRLVTSVEAAQTMQRLMSRVVPKEREASTQELMEFIREATSKLREGGTWKQVTQPKEPAQ